MIFQSKYLFYLILPWEEVPQESCSYFLHAYNTLVTVFDSLKKKLIANSTSQWLILIVSGKTDPFPGQEMVNPPHKNSSENYQSITDPFSGIRIMWVHLSSSKHCDREAVGSHCPGAHVMEELVHWKHVFNKSTFIFKIQCDMGSIVWHLIFVNWSMLTDKK